MINSLIFEIASTYQNQDIKKKHKNKNSKPINRKVEVPKDTNATSNNQKGTDNHINVQG